VGNRKELAKIPVKKIQLAPFCVDNYDELRGTVVIFFEGCQTNNHRVLSPFPVLSQSMYKYFRSYSHRTIGLCFDYKQREIISNPTRNQVLNLLEIMSQPSLDMKISIEKVFPTFGTKYISDFFYK